MGGIFSTRRRRTTVLAIAIALVGGVTAAIPAEASPDPAFGTDGVAGFADIATPGSAGDGNGADFSAVATGTDGRVTVLVNGLTLLRTTASGLPDPSFGTGGKVALSPGAEFLAVDDDGNVALASSTSNQLRILTPTGATLKNNDLCGTGIGAVHAAGSGRWTVALLGCAPGGGVRMERLLNNGALDDTYGDEIPPPTTTTTTTTEPPTTTTSTTTTTEPPTTTTSTTTTTEPPPTTTTTTTTEPPPTTTTTTTTEPPPTTTTTTTTEPPPTTTTTEAPGGAPPMAMAQYGYVDLPATLGTSVAASDATDDGRVALALTGGTAPTIVVVTADGGLSNSPAPFGSGDVRDLAMAPSGTLTWVTEDAGTVLKRHTGSVVTSADPALTNLHSAHVTHDASGDPVLSGTLVLPSGTRHAAVITFDGGLTSTAGAQILVGPIAADSDLGGDLALDRSNGSRMVVAGSVHVAAAATTALGLFRFDGAITRPNRAPVGATPAVVPYPQLVRVTGWAIDPDAQIPITVRLLIDGVVKDTLSANTPNNASLASFASLGINHGYAFELGDLEPGPHQVCVDALDDLSGAATSLGCGDPTVPNGEPIGTLDYAPRIGTTDRLLIGGTAFDPDVPNGPTAVDIYVNGNYAGEALAGADRKWRIEVSAGWGWKELCAFVQNTGYGSSQTIGCLQFELAAPAIDWVALGRYLEAVRAAQMRAFWAFVAFIVFVQRLEKAKKAKTRRR